MAYKRNHLLLEDCVMAYEKKRKHNLHFEDCVMTHKKKKHHLLPKDCVIEILSKLPIKSIIKFKCVSKSWYVLLVSSYFSNTYMKLNEKTKTKLLFINTLGDKFLSFNLKDGSFVSVLNHGLRFCSLVACCNEIICFRSNDDNIILLNPYTGEFKALPHFTHFPEVHVRNIGFGFDDLNNDYKVILILSVYHTDTQRGHRYTYETAVYSLRSSTWRKLQNENRSTKSGYVVPISFSLFFNKRFHWDAYDDRLFDYRHPVILSMDISSEVFYEFQYLDLVLLWKDRNEVYSTDYYQTNLQVIRGFFSVILFHMMPNCLSSNRHSKSEQYIDIWSMKEYGVKESWSKQYTIGPYFSISRALSIRKHEGEVHYLKRVLSIRENEDEEEEEDHILLQIGNTNICELVRWNLLKNEVVQKYCLENLHINMETLYSQSFVSIAKNNLDSI